jgi:hypothetical protein
MYGDAIAALTPARSLSGDWPPIVSELAYTQAWAGNVVEARRLAGALREQATQRFVDPYLLAVATIGLGDKEQTFARLNEAVAVKSGWLPWLRWNRSGTAPARGGGPGVGRGVANAPTVAGPQGGANTAGPPPANRGAGAPGNQGGGVGGFGGGFGGGGGRGGQTLMLNQVGPVLTGELVGGGGGGGGSAAPVNNEIFGGKIEGNTVTFYVWRGTDKPYKLTYTGTVNASGDEIAFTVTGAPARGRGQGGAGATPAPTIARRSH